MAAGVSAIAIDLGYAHTCAIEAGGGVKCWGYNYNGQLGTERTMDQASPAAVPGARRQHTHTSMPLCVTMCVHAHVHTLPQKVHIADLQTFFIFQGFVSLMTAYCSVRTSTHTA